MIIGSVLALTFSAKHSEAYDIQEIKFRLLSTISIVSITVTISLMGVFLAASYKIIKDISKISKYYTVEEAEECLMKIENSGYETDSTNDSDYTDELVRIQKYQEAKEQCFIHNSKWLKVAVFTFPWFAGFMSGMMALTAKCCMMLLSHITDKANYSAPFTYVIVAFVLIFSVTEITILNLGFRYFDTAIVIPIFKASIVFHNTMCGGVLMQEFFTYDSLHLWMYALGILICIIGILFMLVPKERQIKKKLFSLVKSPTEPLILKVSHSINDDECKTV